MSLEPEDNDAIVLIVDDSWIGIPKTASGAVQQIRQGVALRRGGRKGNGTRNDHCQGTGRKTGGAVEVESEEGKGTRFRLTFPRLI